MKICELFLMWLMLTCATISSLRKRKPPGPALLTAVIKGRKGRLKDIFKRKNFDVNYQEKYGTYGGYTALLWACEKGNLEIVEKLLEKGAIINHKSYSDVTALYVAARNGHLDIVKLLLGKGAKPNVPAASGFTALLQATWHGYLSIVQELLKNKANPNIQTLHSKYFALYLATKQNNLAMAKTLIEAGADVNLQTSWGVSALETACVWGFLSMTKLLLDVGANPNLRNIYNQTALIKASVYGYRKILPELINAGAQIDLQDSYGCTALTWASKRGHSTVVAELLQGGGDPYLRDKSGRTSLQWARMNGHTKVLEELNMKPCSSSFPNKKNDRTREQLPCRKVFTSTSKVPEIIDIRTTSLPSSTFIPIRDSLDAMPTYLHGIPALSPKMVTESIQGKTKIHEKDMSQSHLLKCSAISPLVPNMKFLIFSTFLNWQRIRTSTNL